MILLWYNLVLHIKKGFWLVIHFWDMKVLCCLLQLRGKKTKHNLRVLKKEYFWEFVVPGVYEFPSHLKASNGFHSWPQSEESTIFTNVSSIYFGIFFLLLGCYWVTFASEDTLILLEKKNKKPTNRAEGQNKRLLSCSASSNRSDFNASWRKLSCFVTSAGTKSRELSK